jgi:hypothetical protein
MNHPGDGAHREPLGYDPKCSTCRQVTEQPVNVALLDRTFFMGRLLMSGREAHWVAAL